MSRLHARPVRVLVAAALTLVCSEPVAAGAIALDPGAGAVRGASEKELLATFKEGFAASDPAARAVAVTALGVGSRQLSDKGTSKRVAQALVKGLEDKEFEVGAASLFQLVSAREPDTVIGALDPFLRGLFRQLERRVESTDDLSRNYVERATVMFENACLVLANFKDDRAVTTFIALLEALEPDTKKNDLGSRLVGALATAALDEGAKAAVEATVMQTKTFGLPAQAAGARKLHDALAEFATKAGATPPEWSDHYAAEWQSWLEANRSKFPEKLGQLATPPKTEPRRGLAGLPGKAA